MKPSVYIETSVVGHLTSRLSADQTVLGQMMATRQWWSARRLDFDLFTSDAVRTECARGDPEAARQRLEIVDRIASLPLTEICLELAELLLTRHALPAKARVDAIHIGIAAVNSIEYLLTWNCRHIANATLRTKIESTCRGFGYNSLVLCTPYELQERV
jgi:hypothetical protein